MRLAVSATTGLAALLVTLWLIGCAQPLIGAYSPTAYENATSLKAETLSLMEKANEPYADHKASVDHLYVELRKAHEFVKGLPGNSISAQQWGILIDKDGALIGQYFSRWQEKSQLRPGFMGEKILQVGKAFDEIICLEANKEKATSCTGSKGD